jgi:hypothetical protein
MADNQTTGWLPTGDFGVLQDGRLTFKGIDLGWWDGERRIWAVEVWWEEDKLRAKLVYEDEALRRFEDE